jgi:hypothetical protein
LGCRFGGVSFRKSQARDCLLDGCDSFKLLIRELFIDKRLDVNLIGDGLRIDLAPISPAVRPPVLQPEDHRRRVARKPFDYRRRDSLAVGRNGSASLDLRPESALIEAALNAISCAETPLGSLKGDA